MFRQDYGILGKSPPSWSMMQEDEWKGSTPSHCGDTLAGTLGSAVLLSTVCRGALCQPLQAKVPVTSSCPCSLGTPKCSWTRKMVRLSAEGSTGCQLERGGFLLWKAWDSSLTTALRILLSNGRAPSRFSSSPHSGSHAGPTSSQPANGTPCRGCRRSS